MSKPRISVIVRTKNEEKWIGHCLSRVFSQDVNADIEVILVDNESTDHTVNIAKRHPVKEIISVSDFLPGRALNDGMRASSGEYLVCLSAHCVPKDNEWLSSLMSNLTKNQVVAGVYGRQLPLKYTDPIDKRDLMIVFGLDRRVQVKDYFFHNANSMLRREIWEDIPFDEQVTNIEDRVWGKAVIDAGYQIVYEPSAAVYHHHGLHQGNAPERARGVVSIIERVDAKDLNGLPKSMLPENLNVAAIIPIIGEISYDNAHLHHFHKAVDEAKNSKFIKSIYCITQDQALAESVDVKWIDRISIEKADSLGLDELLRQALVLIESQGNFPEGILYINHDYTSRPKGIFDELIVDAQHKGLDTVFPGLMDYGHYWFQNEREEYEQTDPSLKPRTQRDPLYKALYGLGTVSASWVMRTGKMVGGKVGILQVSDRCSIQRITKRASD